MAKLGFLGLGIMGAPMAQHLRDAGHEVFLWSHTAAKAIQLAANGSTPCATPADVARQSECVFLCVGDTAMSREVILGRNGSQNGSKDGLIAGAAKGLIIVDCSTIAPSASKALAADLANRGIDFLDAPCTGSKAGAEAGTLTFMVGGEKAVFERVRPFFEAMGKQLYFCGAAGMGLHVKLSQNLLLGNLLQAFNESFVLATKAGVDPELLLDVVNNSAARSGMVSAKAPQVFARNFATNFSVKWLAKDMALMLDSAAELDIPTPVTALSQQLLRAAIASGYGEDDICGSIRVLEDLTGVQVVAPAR